MRPDNPKRENAGTMASPQKFMFDRSFDPEEEAPEKAPEFEAVEEEPQEEVAMFTEEQMAVARESGFTSGKEEGILEAAEAMDRRVHDVLQAIDERFTALFAEQNKANAKRFQEAIRLATGITRKCFPTLNEEHGLDEIENMVSEALKKIIEEPRVVIYTHPDLRQPLTDRIKPITAGAEFEGQVMIMDDKMVEFGDCRVEWGNGGAERNTGELRQKIEEIVEHNVAAADELAHEDKTEESAELTDGLDAELSSGPATSGDAGPTPAADSAESEAVESPAAGEGAVKAPDMVIGEPPSGTTETSVYDTEPATNEPPPFSSEGLDDKPGIDEKAWESEDDEQTQEALVEIPLPTNEATVKAEPDAPEDKGASGNKQALEADMEPDDNDVILEDAIESDADAGADDEAPEDAGMSPPIDSGSLDPGQVEDGSKDS